MKKRNLILLAAAMLLTCSLSAQQMQQPQPLTLWYDYHVRPGKEADFMALVNKVGAPVRDKLMAEGVVAAWGIETPLLRSPGGGTHLIWVSVNDWAAVEKVQKAMRDQQSKMADEEAKANAEAAKKGQKPAMTTAERAETVIDSSKTRDYLTRDLIFNGGDSLPPAGTLPWTRYNFGKVNPGKFAAWRAAWEKYNKPVLDKLVKDGVLLAYGVAVEELRTDGNWTHFVWQAGKDGGAFDKVRDAFNADRARRSQEERDAITAAFAPTTDPDSARGFMTRSVIFKVAGQK